jgi:flagellar protein FlbT
MALKLTLKADERVIAGGAVLKNTSGKTMEISIENEAPVLREKDILSEPHADTPCKRVYLAVQLMYIDEMNLPRYQKLYWELAREIMAAAPSTATFFERISEMVYGRKYYQALKEVRKLIQYEEKVTGHARTTR